MGSLKLRYGLMLLINILKSFMEEVSWDAFGVLNSWAKFIFLCVLLSFLSIRVAPRRPQRFSSLDLLSFFLSVILPQCACWVFILLVWLCTYPSFTITITEFLHCLEMAWGRVSGEAAIDLDMGGGDDHHVRVRVRVHDHDHDHQPSD